MNIGVLAMQGAVAEHLQILSRLGVNVQPVKLPRDLSGLDGLVIPGGESTTIGKMLENYALIAPLKSLAADGFPIFGTCAGMILMAKDIIDFKINTLELMDIGVIRNGYGRQIDSFETDLEIPLLGEKKFHSIFIRAPIIKYIKANVEVLCQIDGNPVAVRQGPFLACAFHPELADDLRLHNLFLEMVYGGVVAKGICR